MPELLLELGCEELPATSVKRAYDELRDAIVSSLSEERLEHGESLCMGTPRRLIVQVKDVAERQPDITKDFRGPSLSAAFDGAGNPTKAFEGFCRGQGVDRSQVRKDGEYVWVTK